MRSFIVQLGFNIIMIIIVATMVVLAMNPDVFSSFLPKVQTEALLSFKTMFISIILEALPFILIGVLIASFMQTFVSERLLQRFIPRNLFIGILFACVFGFIFPVCECGLIPIIRKLIAKGMPLYVGVIFILVGPIVNPIVYASTFTAFRTRPEMVYSRMGLAILVGALIGIFVHYFIKKSPLKKRDATLQMNPSYQYNNVHNYKGHDVLHQHKNEQRDLRDHNHVHKHQHGNKLLSMLEHSTTEFFEMGKYLMFGCFITAAILSFVPRSDLLSIGQDELGSHFFMMGLAYILSICSTSDAFVASSFASTFSMSSLLAFLVFGPMLDFKSTLMLLSVFKVRFIILLTVLLSVFVFIGSYMIGRLVF